MRQELPTGRSRRGCPRPETRWAEPAGHCGGKPAPGRRWDSPPGDTGSPSPGHRLSLVPEAEASAGEAGARSEFLGLPVLSLQLVPPPEALSPGVPCGRVSALLSPCPCPRTSVSLGEEGWSLYPRSSPSLPITWPTSGWRSGEAGRPVAGRGPERRQGRCWRSCPVLRP